MITEVGLIWYKLSIRVYLSVTENRNIFVGDWLCVCVCVLLLCGNCVCCVFLMDVIV